MELGFNMEELFILYEALHAVKFEDTQIEMSLTKEEFIEERETLLKKIDNFAGDVRPDELYRYTK